MLKDGIICCICHIPMSKHTPKDMQKCEDNYLNKTEDTKPLEKSKEEDIKPQN
jgi:hypothetical protein